MSSLELNYENGKAKGKNVLQDVADAINDPKLEDKDTMSGIRVIKNKDKIVKEAILAHEASKGKEKDDNQGTPIVTAKDIKEAMYR